MALVGLGTVQFASNQDGDVKSIEAQASNDLQPGCWSDLVLDIKRCDLRADVVVSIAWEGREDRAGINGRVDDGHCRRIDERGGVPLIA